MGALGALPAAGLAQAGAAGKTGLYLLATYELNNGTQPARLNEYMSKRAIPALQRAHGGPAIVLEAVIAPHSPRYAVIAGFKSMEELWSVRAKLNADKEWLKGVEAWQSGPEPAFQEQAIRILEATDYSPEVVPLDPPPPAPRLFELRVYHSPTYGQLRALHERFAGPEIKLFHKHGVNPILYTSTVFGPDMPNLTYVIPFSDLAAREKAWAAFNADPEWTRVRAASIEKAGQISLYSQISIYRATAYSPIR
jgi:hypothetical protein